jgi:RNA polymerase sigma factor (sigma-70 family)
MEESDHAAERREQFISNCGRYRKELCYYGLSKVRNKADAEEIAHEIITLYFATMEKRGWPEIENPMAYMITSAKRLIIKLARRQKEVPLDDDGDEQGKQVRKHLDEKAMHENDPTADYEKAIFFEKLFEHLCETILSDLSDEEWSLLYMHHVEQMKAKEIAAELGMDAEKVSCKINKIMARLRHRARGLDK